MVIISAKQASRLSRNIGEGLATQIDLATRSTVEQAHQDATRILQDYHDLLVSLAEALLEHETLDAAGLAEIWGDIKAPELPVFVPHQLPKLVMDEA